MLTIVAELLYSFLFSGTVGGVVTRGIAALFGANNRRTHAAQQRNGGVLYKSYASTFN